MNKRAPLPFSETVQERAASNTERGPGMAEGQTETNSLDRKVSQAQEADRDGPPDRAGRAEAPEPTTSSWAARWALGSECARGLEGRAAGASLQCSDEVELLPVLAGEDGGLFVVLHQLVHGGEPPLPDAVDIVHELHLEMFVLP